MTDLAAFFWALGGSAATEVVTAYFAYMAGKIPPHYSKPGYWVVRVLLLVVAGGVAVAMGANTKITAFGIGAAAPLIIEKMRRGGLGT